MAVRAVQVGLLAALVGIWEVAARLGWINDFLLSSPSAIWRSVSGLYADGSLFKHILTSTRETIFGFTLGTVLGVAVAVSLWWSGFAARVLDPYLVVLNALPKIALGPMFIIWLGVGTNAIVAVALTVSIITTIIMVYAGFMNVDQNLGRLIRSMGGSKWQLLSMVVIPASLPTIVATLKVNVGLSWVGVIVGEFLVSQAGLGYLAIYGGQVLNMNLVMASVFILAVEAAIMYQLVAWMEKSLTKRVVS
jgi:NitT/TauT family transport system permease protein